MIIDEQKKSDLLEIFKCVHENAMNAKALTSSNSDLFKAQAESLQIEVCDLKEAYKFWKKFEEKKKGDFDNVSIIFEALINKEAVQ
jgi:hypothetical protein